MSDSTGLRRTPLYEAQQSAGGRMVPFAGWEMPVQYTGVIDEHLAVRTRAGLFDVSHMGEATVRGPRALEYLQRLTCNDLSKMKPGRAQYNALTTPAGTFVDDLVIYKLDEQDYLLVLNAANTAKDLRWLRDHAAGQEVEVRDVSDDWSQLALQGPEAEAILAPLTADPLDRIRYYRFVRTEVDGIGCIVSRTGYTGEDGFELYGPPGDAARLWSKLLEVGASRGLVPVGLAARDTLRLEAKMALYGNDIDDTTTVLEADLGWIVKLDKGEFFGREVLARQASEGLERKLIGFEMRGRSIARPGYSVSCDGKVVGRVTSGTHAPFLKKNIGLAYLPVGRREEGTEFEVQVRDRTEPAVVVPTPFYKRPR